MRIAMVSEHANPLATLGGVDAGGQNVHVAALAAALGRVGDEVVVHTRRDSPSGPARVPLAPGATVDHVHAGPLRPVPKDELVPFLGDFAAELRRRWEAAPPDLVHAHFWMSGLVALEAARPLGIPVVQTFHALGAEKRRHQGSRDTSPPGRVAHERGLVAGVDHTIATCSHEIFELIGMGGRPDRMSIVPCGVDMSVFTPGGPAMDRRDGLRRIAVVGRLVERKGIADVLAAVAAVPGTELIVAGGPAPEELASDTEARAPMAMARHLGIERRVRFVGRLDRCQVAMLLRSSDVLVTVPWYEPFGIVPLEAMACGLPVVAAGVGGLLDTVVDGVTGVLVPPRSPGVLTEALGALLDDPVRLAAMGRAGAARARERYAWSRVAAATQRVYRRVASRNELFDGSASGVAARVKV